MLKNRHLFQISTPSGPGWANRPAFTLVELMMVVVVLGLLTAILIPALSGITSKGRAAEELGGARAAVAAWNDYAIDRNGELLKGYYPDSEPSTDPLYDFNGNLIAPGPPQQRWFWRLAPYLEDPKRAFYPQALETVRRELIDIPDHQYSATIHPGFGLNGEWFGGLGDSLTNPLYALYEYGNLQRRPWKKNLSDIRNSGKLIVFASSRFGSNDSNGGGYLPGVVEGFHRIESPCDATNGYRWATTDNGTILSDMTNDPADHGFVSARHAGKAVTAMADGSTRLETLGQIGDMRRWADDAWKRDWLLVP